MVKRDRLAALAPHSIRSLIGMNVVVLAASYIERGTVGRPRDASKCVRNGNRLQLAGVSVRNVEDEDELGRRGGVGLTPSVLDEVVAAGQNEQSVAVRAHNSAFGLADRVFREPSNVGVERLKDRAWRARRRDELARWQLN